MSNELRHEDIALRRLLKAEPDEGTYDAAHRVVGDLERLRRMVASYLELTEADDVPVRHLVTHAEKTEAAGRKLRAELGRRVRE